MKPLIPYLIQNKGEFLIVIIGLFTGYYLLRPARKQFRWGGFVAIISALVILTVQLVEYFSN